MTIIPLTLGPLDTSGFTLLRSGIRWLVTDGQWCEAHRPIGFFNVSVEATGNNLSVTQNPFAEEMDLQVAIAPRVSGRLRLSADMARGGYLSIRTIEGWLAGAQVGEIEVDGLPREDNAGELRALMLAGRRMTALADVHSGLLPGWHSRSRAWWGEGKQRPVTLLGQGVCDVTGAVLGAQTAFTEMFEMEQRPTQLVHVPDHPVAPCAPILLDQVQRTAAQSEAIAADIHKHFTSLAEPPSAKDWQFIGTLLTVLQAAPLKDRYAVFTPGGMQQLGPPDAVLLSLAVEPRTILRHSQLGYHIHVMRHHQAAAGPAVRAWLASAFEPVKRSTDSIRADYERLINSLDKLSGTRVMLLNRMSSSGHEDISSYLGFDAPLSSTLSYVAAKEANLMLYDIAESCDIDVIDVDAMAAELGGAEHVPDGIHQSGLLQALVRREILDCLSVLRS